MHPALLGTVYHLVDSVVRGLARLLVPLFLVGMAGSALVVAITIVHDMVDFFSHEGENDMPTADNMKAS